MIRSMPPASALALMIATSTGGALAAAPGDWSKIPGKKITVFYTGAAAVEWVTKTADHSGARGLRKGETCASCHDEEAADIGRKIVSGEKLEPNPPKGKAGSVQVTVQTAHDDANLYLRFQWKQPPASGGQKMDADNQVKIAFMLDDNKVDLATLGGCWSACHSDVRSMPGVKDEGKTKYVKDASLAAGRFYDLLQWRSGKGGKGFDGYVADKRVMEGGKALVAAEGKQSGDTWTVTFTRKLSGGEGDHALVPGKLYNFGFAIHDEYANARYHYVSFGYSLGLDNAKAQINATKL